MNIINNYLEEAAKELLRYGVIVEDQETDNIRVYTILFLNQKYVLGKKNGNTFYINIL